MTTSTYIVSSGVTSSGITLSAFDTMSVLNGGSALDTTVLGEGVEWVLSGGTAISTTVSAHSAGIGMELVEAGGAASGTDRCDRVAEKRMPAHDARGRRRRETPISACPAVAATTGR